MLSPSSELTRCFFLLTNTRVLARVVANIFVVLVETVFHHLDTLVGMDTDASNEDLVPLFSSSVDVFFYTVDKCTRTTNRGGLTQTRSTAWTQMYHSVSLPSSDRNYFNILGIWS